MLFFLIGFETIFYVPQVEDCSDDIYRLIRCGKVGDIGEGNGTIK